MTLSTHNPGNEAACSFDSMLHLLDPMGQEIASDDDLGPGSCSKIAPATHPSASNLNAGTYFVWIQKFNDDATVPLYQLDLTLE